MKLIYTSTKPKSKPKKKPGWQKEQAEYEVWLNSHGSSSKKTRKSASFVATSPVVTSNTPRETKYYPSLNTHTGSTAPAAKKVYTGDKIVGIAAMHKSNLVPIFNDDSAKDVASMRR